MDVREHRDRLVRPIDVQKLIDVVPWLNRFRELERVHEDRTIPTMGIVVQTINEYVALIRDAERTLEPEIVGYAHALSSAAMHYFPRENALHLLY